MGEADLTIPQAFDLGCGMAHHGNHAAAVGVFRGILEHTPEDWDVVNRLGASLFELKRYHEAFWWFWLGREACPRDPKILGNFASTLSQLGHPEKAVPDFERAVALAEKQGASHAVKALAYNNLGNTLERVSRYKDAERALKRGIEYDPSDPFPYYNAGIVLMRLNRHDEGMNMLRLSLEIGSLGSEESVSRINRPDVLYNMGICHLLHGEFKEGWEGYESRLLTSENEHPNLGLAAHLKVKPGDSIEGKHVVVHCEQGVGDAIQFMRFLPELRRKNPAAIMLVAHRAVRHLFEFDGVTVLQPGVKIVHRTDGQEEAGVDIRETYDCWIAQMSLPLFLGIEREDQFPPPYAPRVPAQKLYDWAHVHDSKRLNVGICWAGFFKHKNDTHRSIPLHQFSTLFDVPGVHLISVQQVRHQDVDVLEGLKKEYPEHTYLDLTDFADTAAVLAHCDLVISADTSVAHMAGALGLPTWVFIPKFSTDWRWQLGDRTDSPWYPSMRLFRQDRRIGDWRPTLARVKAALESVKQSVKREDGDAGH